MISFAIDRVIDGLTEDCLYCLAFGFVYLYTSSTLTHLVSVYLVLEYTPQPSSDISNIICQSTKQDMSLTDMTFEDPIFKS